MKFEEDFDGDKKAGKREAHLSNKQVHTLTNSNIDKAIDEQIQGMTTQK